MSFERIGLIDACRAHGLVTRVVVIATRGSTPREVGAAMLVWQGGMSGTIGGGTLEHEAMQAARRAALPGSRTVTRHALGPDMGQCCGGSVDLLSETFDLQLAEALSEDVIVRGPGEMPLAVARLKAQARSTGVQPAPQLIAGWMIEPVSRPTRHIWIWGAGHVGRALVDVLHPLPGVALVWVDTAPTRFPATHPSNTDMLVASDPTLLVRHAPRDAEHLIVTYSHALDLDLCNRLLTHGFAYCGLIGSATKWARFRSRLAALGHAPEVITRITCPIGRPALGKHPHVIALGVAADMISGVSGSTRLEGYG